MELPIVAVVLAFAPLAIYAVGDYNAVYADPMQITAVNTQKRETAGNEISQAVHNRLLKHGEALEKIMRLVQINENLIKQIIDRLDEKHNQSETHGNIKIYHSNRRSDTENEDIPIVKFGKDIVRYGNLLQTVVMTDITKDPGPVTAMDTNESPNDGEEIRNVESINNESRTYSGTQNPTGSERIFHGKEAKDWCSVAAKCKKTSHPICGFDDTFGKAVFNDICHMLQVNCYMRFNFTVVPC